MDREHRNDGFVEVEDRFAGYTVYDRDYDKIGKVDDLFLDEADQPEYIGVKMGFLGTSSTLIPFSAVRVNDERQLIEVAAEREHVKNGPAFNDDQEITPELELEVYSHYGVESTGVTDPAAYGAYYATESEGDNGRVDLEPGERAGATGYSGTAGPGITMGDTDSGEFREHDPSAEGVAEPDGSDLEDEDELRVQRTEEELRTGTREREAGSVNVRKRVRTDREHVEVPTRREEIYVDRVPVEGEAAETEIGDDEVRMPVTEEEVVVEKRPVAKEEIRIRKDVVEDTETIEEDVRREEVDVDDETTRRDR